MGQIIKSLGSVCHSVSLAVNTPTAAILIRFWWNFAQWFGARKNKIEFVQDKNVVTPSPILPQFLKKIALQPVGTSKRYNSVPVKDNCALFASTPVFSGPGYPTVSFKFLPWRPLLIWPPTVFTQKQNWLQAHKSVKRWNAAARLYSVKMGQIPPSTERISTFS